MKSSPLLLLTLASATILAAQDTKPADPAKPADPKVPTHSPEQSALNKAKEDVRHNDVLKKAAAKLQKAIQDNEAGKKEVERAEKSKIPTTEEGKKKLEELKNKVDKKDLKSLENMVKDGVREGTKALRERNKKGTEENPKAENPVPETDTVPGTFSNNTEKEQTLPARKAPVFQTAPVSADDIIPGLQRDPKKPEVELPSSDPRTRTYVLNGTARLRRPDIVLDADEVEVLFREGHSPGVSSTSAPKPKKGQPGDPVKAGTAGKGAPIERLVARGRVRFMIVGKDGRVTAGRCGNLVYEDKTGWFILKGSPEVEAEGRLVRGPRPDSVMRLSRTEPSDLHDCEVVPLDRELNMSDVPKDRETVVPSSRPERAKP